MTGAAESLRSDIGERLRSAATLSPERLPRLKTIGDDWARRIGEAIGEVGVLPIVVELADIGGCAPDLVGLDCGPDAEGALLTSRKFAGSGLVILDQNAAEFAVAALFGGEGHGAEAERRAPTELDRALISLVISRATTAARAAFQPVAELLMEAGGILFLDRLVEELSAAREGFLAFRFNLAADGRGCVMTVAIPESFLSPHKRELALLPEEPGVPEDEDWSRDIKAGLARADMTVRAVLVKQMLPLSRIAAFAVGQTIPLESGIDSLVAIECEDRCLFRGRVGRSRDLYVVRIEQKVDPAEEFLDDILSH